MSGQIKKLIARGTINYLLLTLLIGCPLAAMPQTGQSAQPESQTSPQITIRTTTRLVVLDIVATDAKGNAVKDLKPEEVQILENGKEQKKRDFSFQEPDA